MLCTELVCSIQTIGQEPSSAVTTEADREAIHLS